MNKYRTFISKYWYLLTIIIFIGIAIFWFLISKFNFSEDLNANIYTEFLGILFTIIIVDRLYIFRGIQQEKTRLISQMASPTNSITIDAIRLLRLNNWLIDGTIDNENFSYGNFNKADLGYASVINSNFRNTKLMGANLSQANMTKVKFHDSNLNNSICHNSNFNGAEIHSSDYSKYNINNVDFYSTNLTNVSFIIKINGDITTNPDDVLRYVKRLQLATMPDGKKYNGKYNLQGDIVSASAQNVNIEDPNEMSKFYDVSLEEYQEGQEWYSNSGISTINKMGI